MPQLNVLHQFKFWGAGLTLTWNGSQACRMSSIVFMLSASVFKITSLTVHLWRLIQCTTIAVSSRGRLIRCCLIHYDKRFAHKNCQFNLAHDGGCGWWNLRILSDPLRHIDQCLLMQSYSRLLVLAWQNSRCTDPQIGKELQWYDGGSWVAVSTDWYVDILQRGFLKHFWLSRGQFQNISQLGSPQPSCW